MLNVLIAVVSDSYDGAMSKAKRVFYHTRLESIAELDSFIKALAKIFKWLDSPRWCRVSCLKKSLAWPAVVAGCVVAFYGLALLFSLYFALAVYFVAAIIIFFSLIFGFCIPVICIEIWTPFAEPFIDLIAKMLIFPIHLSNYMRNMLKLDLNNQDDDKENDEDEPWECRASHT
jgi:hypothetical protein